MNLFKSLGLSDEIVKALEDLKIVEPTDIQNQAIPHLLKGEVDFIGLAQTGTGKTAAFGLPAISRIDTKQAHIQTVVVVPTRELCIQIAEQLKLFSRYVSGIRMTTIYGGASITGQIKEVKRKPHLLVATPGRLIDMIKRKVVRLEKTSTVVLDEADEMLQMGFQEDIDEILSVIPDNKRIWLFSATMPSVIRKIVNKYMHDPIEVRINTKEKVNKDITHQYLIARRDQKVDSLMAFLDQEMDFYGIVFCRTKIQTQKLSDALVDQGYKSDALHGDLSQKQREKVMNRFKAKKSQLVIATDVAARGIDVDDLTHIVHYDLPDDLAYYTHRSGRTGRAGKKGISLAFITKGEQRRISQLKRSLQITFEPFKWESKAAIQSRKVKKWITSILETDESMIEESVLDEAMEAFDEIDGALLLKKLIAHSIQLPPDTTEQESSTDDERSVPIFINIGKNDRLSKKDLVILLLRKSNLKKNDFGRISVSRRHSIVRVNPSVASKLISQFSNFKHKGRRVIVRKDRD